MTHSCVKCTFIVSQDELAEFFSWRVGVLSLGSGPLWALERLAQDLNESGDSDSHCVAPGHCPPSLGSSEARSLLLAPSPLSGTPAAWVSSQALLPSPPGPSRHLSPTTLTLECWRCGPGGRQDLVPPQTPPAVSSQPFCSHRRKQGRGKQSLGPCPQQREAGVTLPSALQCV